MSADPPPDAPPPPGWEALAAQVPNIPAATFTFVNSSSTALSLDSDKLVLGTWVKEPPNSLEENESATATALSDGERAWITIGGAVNDMCSL